MLTGVRMRCLLVCSAITIGSFGCASDAHVLTERLTECGLLTEGEVGASALAPFYAPSACYRECLATAECDALEDAMCGTSIELLRACDERCAYRCPDDSLIGIERVCDGAAQCEGGADEEGCATFACGDGTTVATRARCDGSWHCPGGQDEMGCPPPFSCMAAWGTSSGDWMVCDGWAQCVDGSDERDCPVHQCANGDRHSLRIGAQPRCDGWTQCSDGSDEAGCAQLMPMCAMP